MPNAELLLIAFPIAAAAYAVYAVGPKVNRGDIRKLTAYTMPATVPWLVALIVIFVFIIAGVGRTVQFNVDRDFAMTGWSLWVRLWMPLVILTVISSLGNLVWVAVAAVTRRQWIAPALLCWLLSIMAFVTVFYNYPRA